MRDIQRAQQIRRLIDELGVNLAGVEVILNMADKINEMEQRLVQMQQAYEAEIARLRAQLGNKG
jgi:MerR family transcriptional regulator, heat shock protein HspR